MRENIWEPLSITGITFFPYDNPDLKDKVPGLTVRTPDGQLVPFDQPFLNTGSTDAFGGHGAYATMGDYIKIQQSILADDGKLLKPETVETMFTPQLSAEGKEGLKAFRRGPYGGMLIGEQDPDIDTDFGIGAIIFLEDGVGRRKKGTLNWGGMTNPF